MDSGTQIFSGHSTKHDARPRPRLQFFVLVSDHTTGVGEQQCV